jgi:hypothetical protein
MNWLKTPLQAFTMTGSTPGAWNSFSANGLPIVQSYYRRKVYIRAKGAGTLHD